MAPCTPNPHKGMLFSAFSLLSSPPFLLPNKPPPLHLPITSPSSPFTTVRSARRMRSCSLASTDRKLQGSWIHGDVIPDDGFGGWLVGKPEIEDGNAALPKLIIVGVGTSMTILLAALSFYSFSRKGNIRRLQPHKPVTKAQAAVALTSGRMAEAIRMELSKIVAEELAKSADMEEIRSELIHKGDIQRLWEEKLIKERDRGFEVERDFHVALHDLETEKMVRDEKFAFYMKEKVALDCQRQLLSNLREEVDGMCDRLTTERVNIVSEQHSLEKTSAKVLARQEGLIEAKSILEAEKEALEILRATVRNTSLRRRRNALQSSLQIVQVTALCPSSFNCIVIKSMHNCTLR